MERFYSIAGSTYRIIGPDQLMYREDGVLKEFRTDGPEYDYLIEVESGDTLDKPTGTCVFCETDKCVFCKDGIQERYEGTLERSWENAYMKVTREGAHSKVRVKKRGAGQSVTAKQILTAMESEHRIVENGGFILHASYIRWGDGAILFTAPSGTGKSTQAELWRQLRGAELLNGDRVVVMPEKKAPCTGEIDEKKARVYAWGTPYSGSSGVSKNATLPILAIVYLSQAPETRITPVRGVRAFRDIWEGCSVNIWNRRDMEICSETVMRVLETVPLFHLACTPDETAVNALEKELERLR